MKPAMPKRKKNHTQPKASSPRVRIEEPVSQQLQVLERFSRLHNQVAEEFTARAQRLPATDARLLKGFIEIANFMLKNTCGVGSNIQLAECRLEDLDPNTLRKYYTLMLTLLGYHFNQMLPAKKKSMWDQILRVTDDRQTCEDFARELEACRDHQDGTYSSVRGGRKLWERVGVLLNIIRPEENTTARIYYQTAPAQDLVFMVEQAMHEGWFQEE